MLGALAAAALDHLALDQFSEVNAEALRKFVRERLHAPRDASRLESSARLLDLPALRAGGCDSRPRLAGPCNALTETAIHRINLALQLLSGVERRRAARFALALPARLDIDGRSLDFTATDIGAKGLRLLARAPHGIEIGVRGAVTLGPAGPAPVEVRNANAVALNLVFLPNDEPRIRAAFAGLLLRLATEQNFLAAQAMDLALEVTAIFERALALGHIETRALFDDDYRLEPGSEPPQFRMQALDFLRETLPPLLERARAAHSRAVYAVATDRNGYVPVHNAEHARPQRPGDPAYNLVHARDRRIYTDEVTLKAARFSKGALVQSYPRDLEDHPHAHVLDASAPVIVRGRRWGCVQIGFRCEGSGPFTSAAAGAPSPA